MEISRKSLKENLQKLTSDKNEELKIYLDNILDKLPKQYSSLINEAFIYKRIPKEYLLSSILFAVSSSIGLTFYIKALGYCNYANCYFTIIGSRGDTKTEAKKIATTPLVERDNIDYEAFLEESKHCIDNDIKIKRKQILVQNSTIEATHQLHRDNPNSIGIFIDEIYILIEKMTNPSSRDGSDWRKFFIEGYTNDFIDIARKTTDSFRIKKSYPTLMGGLQNEFIPFLFSKGNLESGFIDRLLFTTKITANNNLVRGEINPNIINDYNLLINNILSYKRQSEKIDEKKKQFQIFLNNDAESKIFEYTQNLINRKIKAPPIIKEYMSKMQISIHKLSLLVFMMRNALNKSFSNNITIQDVELSITLNEFYLLNFKTVLDKMYFKKKELPTVEAIIEIAKQNNASQKAVAEITGLHKGTISKKWNNLSGQLAT